MSNITPEQFDDYLIEADRMSWQYYITHKWVPFIVYGGQNSSLNQIEADRPTMDEYTAPDAQEAWERVMDEETDLYPEMLSSWRIERIASYGGEGLGSKYWLVLKFIHPDGTEQLFKRDGYYASYDGGYLPYATRTTRGREVTVIEYS